MHGQFRHTLCLSQHAPKWAMTDQLSFRGKADSCLVTAHFGDRLGVFFY